MPDELSSVYEKPFSEEVSKLQELITQSIPTFLIGAGCSRCVDIPLTEELTQQIIESNNLCEHSKEILSKIQAQFKDSKSSNIEDYLSEMIDLMSIADRRAARGASGTVLLDGSTEYTLDQVRNAAEQIKQAIVKVVERPVDLGTHRNFVVSVHRPVRVGIEASPKRADYLILNYDTTVEDSLALEKVPFADGIDGGETGWWDPTTFDRDGLAARVFKLHGSVNWYEFQDDPLPRRIGSNVRLQNSPNQRILIWPASTKYREAQRDPFAQLSNRAWNTLRPDRGRQSLLIICGYSFRDTHVNNEIEKSILESRGDLTVVALVSENKPVGQLGEWHSNPEIGEQLLIFANNGFFHGSYSRESEHDLVWWKFENLTRILGGHNAE